MRKNKYLWGFDSSLRQMSELGIRSVWQWSWQWDALDHAVCDRNSQNKAHTVRIKFLKKGNVTRTCTYFSWRCPGLDRCEDDEADSLEARLMNHTSLCLSLFYSYSLSLYPTLVPEFSSVGSDILISQANCKQLGL